MAKRLKANFSFGSVSAEHDPLLNSTYMDNGEYSAVASYDNPQCFIIGRTGSGKSALFRHLKQNYPNNLIQINPESLMFNYITNLDAVTKLSNAGIRLDVFFKALWKHVLVIEILKHHFKLDEPNRRSIVWSVFIQKLMGKNPRRRAIDYIEQFQDHFWQNTQDTIVSYADKFDQTLASSIDMDLQAVKGSASYSKNKSSEVNREVITKYQTIVNKRQVPELEDIIEMLSKEKLSPINSIYVVIDELDQPFTNSDDDNIRIDLIRCLFDTVIELKSIKYIKILVALRTNIFQQLNYARRSRSGQEEKIQSYSITINWNYKTIESMLESRADAATKLYDLGESSSLDLLLPKREKGKNPITYIIERTLMRPRDAILFINKCVYQAIGDSRISWPNIYKAEEEYSSDRLNALRDEWKDPYFGIEGVFDFFRNSNALLNRFEMGQIIDSIAVGIIGNDSFEGIEWISDILSKTWETKEYSWDEKYYELIKILYKISFIAIVNNRLLSNGQIKSFVQFSYSQPNIDLLQLSEETSFFIHPAFHKVLNITQNFNSDLEWNKE